MTLLRRLLAVTLLLALAAARASTGVSAPEDPLTLDGLYTRMGAAMSRDGYLQLITIDSRTQIGEHTFDVDERIWMDARAGNARSERDVAFAGSSRAIATIVRGNAAYVLEDGAAPMKREARVCRSAPTAALSLVLACRGFMETVTSTRIVEDTVFDGVPAVTVETRSTTHGRDGVMRYVDRLYVDASSFLPIAFVSDGIRDDGVVASSSAAYSHDWVEAAPLVNAPFDPATIGYMETRPSDGLHPSDTYWLGDRYEPPGIPALVLRGVFVADDVAAAFIGTRVVLTYGEAGDEFGDSVVRISVVDGDSAAHAGAARVMLDGRTIEVEARGTYATPGAIGAIVGGLRRLQ